MTGAIRTQRALVVALAMLGAARADAQQRVLDRVDLSAGGGMFGAGAVGSEDATLRANGATSQPYRLFSTSTRLGTSPLLEARIGVNVSRRFSVEGRFGYSRPEVRTSVTNDAEGAPALTVVERIDQFAIDGGIKVGVDEWRLAGWTPFVTAGAGYLRQLHAGKTLVEQGHEYFVGGGVARPFVVRPRRAVKTVGVRADARLDLLVRGVGNSDSPKPHASVSGAIVFGF